MASLKNTPIQYLKGVGEKRARLFERLGAPTVGALLRLYPRGYEDWTSPLPIASAPLGEVCCVRGRVIRAPREHMIRKGMTLYKLRVTDDICDMDITLFNNKYGAQMLREGETYLFRGKIGGRLGHPEMISPVFQPAESGQRLQPVYPQTEGLHSRTIESAVRQALALLPDPLPDLLPQEIRQKAGLCHLRYAIENIHAPLSQEALETAKRRLIFEEFLLLQLGLFQLKKRSKNETAVCLKQDESEVFYRLLPFSPTNAQRRAVQEAMTDMMSSYPMNRLIQGDVGSGKTAVAAALCFNVVRQGYQAALMAPTEILAEQHFRGLFELLAPAGISCGLLTGSLSAPKKRALLENLAEGSISFVVGTHALLSENVKFQNLGLVVTDEQHRFGVAQRAALAQKGNHPHMLVMSATPIPRTLALMIYGDLDVSILDELPPGRQKIETFAIDSAKRERAFRFVKKHLDEGRQAYIVCPLVDGEESNSPLIAAEQYAQQLKNEIFQNYRVGLLHGKMKSAQKEKVMTDFSAGKLDLLVSTTVIEVGVDVPNAVIMVVENAERFGLSQLHQLRGRVGRGNHQSYCILISDAQNKEALRRLTVMVRTNNGFEIAEEDLKLRGPGDFFGARQHGLPSLRIADLASDMEILKEAQQASKEILANDPSLGMPEHAGLRAGVYQLFGKIGEEGLN